MILVVVEGRRDPLFGMTTNRLARLMQDLGAHVALNLDGGGSSAMVLDGTRVSRRPFNEPSERAVSNHLAILRSAASTGRLIGYVREDDIYDTAAGLAGATVDLSTGDSALTDGDGFYEFVSVPPGDLTVNVSLTGFSSISEPKTVQAGITNWKSVAQSITGYSRAS